MLMLLRQRSFARLWLGGLISLTGDRVLLVALPFYIYQQSHSTLVTALEVAASLVPNLFFSSIAGVLVDRLDRRKILVWSSLAQGLLILPLLWVSSSPTLWIVYLVSFLQATLGVLFSPAETTLLPQLVEADQLLPANALNALNNNIARLVGPLFGGVILGFWGLPGVVLFDSLTFLVSGGLIAGIHIPPPPREASPQEVLTPSIQGRSRFWREFREGIELIRKDRIVVVLFLTTVLVNFGGVMIDPLAAPFITDIVRADSQTYGSLMTVQAVGGLTGGLIAAWAGQRLSPARIYSWGTILVGLLQLFRYNLPTLPVVFVTALIIGLPAAMLAAALDTLFQQVVPNTHLGRIVGVLSTTISIVSLAGVLGIAGGLGEQLGIVPVLNIAAGVTITAGLLGLWLIPAREFSNPPIRSKDPH